MYSRFGGVFCLRQILTGQNIIAPPPYNVASQYPNKIRAGHEAALRKIRPQRRIVRMSLKRRGHSGEEESDLIYEGIAERNFERDCQLADHVQIKGASLENGLSAGQPLAGGPKAMKPRAIPITTAKKVVPEGKAAKIAA